MAAYVGEIRMFAGNFNPNGWMFCQGQTLPISEYETLFQLIGTTYGGDGEETFNLPNLSGRLPLHQGNGYVIGQMAGVEEVTLTTQQIASHSHPFMATTNIGGASAPGNNVLAQSSTIKVYSAIAPTVALGPSSMTPAGGSQPHSNLQPYLCINFIISLFGVFPSQT
ncbi:phage tail protein [Mesorhizobium sp. WSM4312]|uniref:phage tail protein n=1 Tax=unclassified Mesorhizobium TaxID=325217 RepID=UPI000BAF30A7|nr:MULTISPECIES: tail fiber protein [unclassified Mesorhizobium]PBB22774.1 phage tail protein [Mesorhizobium sp. WSM4304]PBB66940.1 phage tail protein [Mesorhizobium sp. WSM4312]PBB71668.1 phage tail protein [Mesorhizobium sp. WSM4308]PBC22002.1 phage tail protein [Mesorhizobium sp. WSM4311]TRC72910.1 phage tail protein [Mesorhizobium sp. WSM4310]